MVWNAGRDMLGTQIYILCARDEWSVKVRTIDSNDNDNGDGYEMR